MNESIIALADGYINLLAWFMTGMPNPLMKEAYRVKSEIEKVLRALTGSQLTGVELAQCVKDKFSDTLPEARALHPDS